MATSFTRFGVLVLVLIRSVATANLPGHTCAAVGGGSSEGIALAFPGEPTVYCHSTPAMNPLFAGLMPGPVSTQMNPFCGRLAPMTFLARWRVHECAAAVQSGSMNANALRSISRRRKATVFRLLPQP